MFFITSTECIYLQKIQEIQETRLARNHAGTLESKGERGYKKGKETARVRAYPVCTSNTSNPTGSAPKEVHHKKCTIFWLCSLQGVVIVTLDASKQGTSEIRKGARRQWEVEFL
jgi:hypothetical protein